MELRIRHKILRLTVKAPQSTLNARLRTHMMGKQLSLPPGGAAALTPAIIAAITAMVSPQDIADGIRKLLDAKLANGQGDVRAIESGIKLYLNYTVGLPVQRIEETQTRVSVAVDPEKLLSNPASLEAIARKLRGTEAGQRLLDALASEPRTIQAVEVPVS